PMHRNLLLSGLLSLLAGSALAQEDDLLKLLGEEETGPEYTTAAFKSTRVINGHSVENTAHGVLDFRIGHRFGPVNGGANEFWGLDQATIRLGLDYGVTDRLMIRIGRSSFEKTLDGFVKYKVLRQCDAGCTMPVTLAFVAGTAINGLKQSVLWPYPAEERPFYFSHRMSYSFQMILGRKFSESVTFQLNPGLVHINLVEKADQTNDIIHVSGAGRMKLSKRVAINAEYFHVLPGQIPDPTAAEVAAGQLPVRNSFSIGFDIETGGHVFQLHMTNSLAMFERGFITGTTEQWTDGGIHFGFNISRVFTLHDPKAKR
ncbi:MAG TPA: DUF5777 family beta-barrel protein, partial [Flavobacteriales bacterium]|nr:DUF5777 family beta-barrel protein [Flavobacteriales bacterium]